MRIRNALATAYWLGLAAAGASAFAVIAAFAIVWLESMWSFGIIIAPTVAAALVGLGIGFARGERR